ncbi:hypothetical protein ANCDUO_14308, partial [Ancylostoma duodenale]
MFAKVFRVSSALAQPTTANPRPGLQDGDVCILELTFRETMADFFNNCTWFTNETSKKCPDLLIQHWTGDGAVTIFTSLIAYYLVYFVLVAICISINVPAGVFVPSFIIGAAGGRLVGEIMVFLFPEGMRGPGGPPIYPGLHAV